MLAAGDAEGALAIMQALEGGPPVDVSDASGASGAPKPLRRAATMPASDLAALRAALPALPRGGTLVKLKGVDELGLGPYNGRMGRVIEMNGRSFMEDGVTELCTVLLDSRASDYDRSSGVWVGVPIANLKIMS